MGQLRVALPLLFGLLFAVLCIAEAGREDTEDRERTTYSRTSDTSSGGEVSEDGDSSETSDSESVSIWTTSEEEEESAEISSREYQDVNEEFRVFWKKKTEDESDSLDEKDKGLLERIGKKIFPKKSAKFRKTAETRTRVFLPYVRYVIQNSKSHRGMWAFRTCMKRYGFRGVFGKKIYSCFDRFNKRRYKYAYWGKRRGQYSSSKYSYKTMCSFSKRMRPEDLKDRKTLTIIFRYMLESGAKMKRNQFRSFVSEENRQKFVLFFKRYHSRPNDRRYQIAFAQCMTKYRKTGHVTKEMYKCVDTTVEKTSTNEDESERTKNGEGTRDSYEGKDDNPGIKNQGRKGEKGKPKKDKPGKGEDDEDDETGMKTTRPAQTSQRRSGGEISESVSDDEDSSETSGSESVSDWTTSEDEDEAEISSREYQEAQEEFRVFWRKKTEDESDSLDEKDKRRLERIGKKIFPKKSGKFRKTAETRTRVFLPYIRYVIQTSKSHRGMWAFRTCMKRYGFRGVFGKKIYSCFDKFNKGRYKYAYWGKRRGQYSSSKYSYKTMCRFSKRMRAEDLKDRKTQTIIFRYMLESGAKMKKKQFRSFASEENRQKFVLFFKRYHSRPNDRRYEIAFAQCMTKYRKTGHVTKEMYKCVDTTVEKTSTRDDETGMKDYGGKGRKGKPKKDKPAGGKP